MAATVKRNIWPRSGDSEALPQLVTLLMAASQGIMIPGCPLYLSTGGTAKRADTSDGTGDVYQYILASDPNGVEYAANAEVQAWRITTDQEWLVYVENNDSDSALAQAQVGNVYGLRVATGAGKIGYVTMDINNANGAVKVMQLYSNVETARAAAADNPGIAIVRFLSTVIDVQRS